VLGAALAGIGLLVAFVRVEARSAAPMVPLALFRSRTFSGVNLLTLLLYAGLGGAFFFLPFALIPAARLRGRGGRRGVPAVPADHGPCCRAGRAG
jgi:hypothetical protein